MSSLIEEAIILHKKGKLTEAESLYKSILKDSKNNFEITHLLGIIKIQLKDFKEAIGWLNKAILINSNNHSVFNNLGVCYKELKEYPKALSCFKNALNIKPDYAEAYNNIAIIYRHLEKYNLAIENYLKAIQLKSNYAEAYNNLGIIYLRTKEFQKAEEVLSQATKIKPDYAEAFYNLGNVYKNLENYEESIKFFSLACKLKKNYHEAYNDLGIVYLNQEEFNKARDLLNEAIKIKPDYAEAYNNLGIVYLSLKIFESSKNSLNQAIRIKPDYAEAYNNLGMLYFKLKEYENSKNNIDKAILLKKDYGQAYISLGSYYESIENFKEAEVNYKNAIKLKEKKGFNNLGILYLNQGRHDDAEKIFNEIIKLKPKNAETYFLRSLVYANSGKPYLALEDLKKSFKLKPEFYNQQDKIYNLLTTQNKICDWNDYKKISTKLITSLHNDSINDINPFGLLTFSDSIELVKKVTQEKIKDLSLKIIQTKFNIIKDINKKIRIGYYSPDFKDHPVGYILSELFDYHDRDRFEIIGFSLSPDSNTNNKIKDKIIKSIDKFIDFSNKDHPSIINESKKLKIDIAIDLAGFTAFNKIKAFIKRVAPIQVNFLGYPGTIGPHNDYIISDLEIISKEKQNFYFEKIIYMPNVFLPSFTKFSPDFDSKKKDFELPETETIVFCNFNNHGKITPTIFNCWMRILKKVNNSILWLLDGDNYSRENLKREAKKRGVEPNRLLFSKREDYYSHTKRYKFCDLFIDTFPYNAHSTASSCLVSKVPLLTIKGETFQSRVASSLLKDLGMNELICSNIEEYENKAIFIASNPLELKRIKNKLQNSLFSSETFNTRRYCENLEKGYHQIYKRYAEELKPENIFIK